MTESRRADDGFVAFFRRYAKTWYHTVATAALTLFGTLTFVDRLFAVVAVAAYVLPPVVLYLTGSLPSGDAGDAAAGADERDGGGRTMRRTGGSDAGDPGRAGAASVEATDGRATASGTDGDDPGGADEGDRPDATPTWTAADAPTDGTLVDVVLTGVGAFAVGDGGVVLADDGDGWEVALSDGPGANANALSGVDATGGGAVWFAGESGALGRFDAATGRHVDHSAPDGDTTNVADLAVAGRAGGDGELVLLVDGSGRVRRGRYRDGEVAWADPETPGSGSSVTGVTLRDESAGFLCDSNDGVYAVRDGGREFERIGLDVADGTLADVAATGPDTCLVAADDGVVHRYDGTNWTPARVADGALWALAAHEGRALAVGDGGAVYERSVGATDWERAVTPATVPLRGAALGASGGVAVGEAGTVVERGPVADGGERSVR